MDAPSLQDRSSVLAGGHAECGLYLIICEIGEEGDDTKPPSLALQHPHKVSSGSL